MITHRSPGTSTASIYRDDRGLTTVEYVILLVVIAIMSVAGWHKFGGTIHDKLTDSQTKFDANVTDTPGKQ